MASGANKRGLLRKLENFAKVKSEGAGLQFSYFHSKVSGLKITWITIF
jgi:hypothetical protein